MLKLFLQDSPNDCGAACLATLLCYHGHYMTPIDLVKQMEILRAGATNKELQETAAKFGLQTRFITLPIESFNRITDPVIAYTQIPGQDALHTLVIFRVKGKKLYIGDPARGKRWMTMDEFSNIYKGYLIVVRPGPDFVKGTFSKSYLAKFNHFIGNYRGAIFKSLLLGLVASAAGFIGIYLSKDFVDRVLPMNQSMLLVQFIVIYFAAKFLNLLVQSGNELYAVHIKNAVHRVLSSSFFSHAIDLEKRHIDSRDRGDFIQQFNQIEGLTQGIATYFSGFILTAFGMLVKAILLIALFDPSLTGIILFIVCLNTGVGFLFSRAVSECANQQSLNQSQINTALLSSLSDVRVVRIFNARQWVMKDYRHLLEDSLNLLKRMTKLRVFGRSFADLFNILGEATIFLVCGWRIMNGSFTLGDFLVFLTFSQGLAVESVKFPALILGFHSYLRAFARIQAIRELPTEPSGELPTPNGALGLECKNVTFGYQKAHPVLKDLSFKIAPGSTTAIVGESGSGKTTLVNLMMGFYQPQTGQILVNDTDLETLNLDTYRKRIAAVFQSTPIFNKNIYNNIAMGNPDLSKEDVAQVAKEIGTDQFIEAMPQAYDYLIYPGSLSGGQTQRVGIMRALCKNFDLLILDEATSHLDSLTESQIVDGINRICGDGRTRIIIAHRLSTVMNADQILVMKQGRLVEIGTHEALVKQKGYYLELIERQYEINLTPSAA